MELLNYNVCVISLQGGAAGVHPAQVRAAAVRAPPLPFPLPHAAPGRAEDCRGEEQPHRPHHRHYAGEKKKPLLCKKKECKKKIDLALILLVTRSKCISDDFKKMKKKIFKI